MGGYASPEQAEASSPYSSYGASIAAEGISRESGIAYAASNPQPNEVSFTVNSDGSITTSSGTTLEGTPVWIDYYAPGGPAATPRAASEQQPGQQQRTLQQAVEQRPGFYGSDVIGDFRTQEMVRSGIPMGRALEQQRQEALLTPGTRDEQYYGAELQKWASQPIEVSSAYHNYGMALGVPITPNPFENVGDQALVFLKGGEQENKQQIGLSNPAAYGMMALVPPEGLQGIGWDTAKGTAQPFNLMPAVDRLYQSAMEMGVYSGAGATFSNTAPEYNRFTTPAPTPRLSDTTGFVSTKWTQGGYVPGQPGGMLAAPERASMLVNEVGLKAPFVSVELRPRLDEVKSGSGGFSLSPAMAGEGTQVLKMDQFFAPGSKAPGILAGQLVQPAPTVPKTWFEETGQAIKNTPILGNFYQAGASVSPKMTTDLSNLFTTAPVLENIAKGGSTYGLMKEAGYQGTETAALRYKESAGKLVGTGTNEATRIFPVAKPFLDVGSWYKSTVTTPFSTFLSPLDSNPVTGALKSGAMGFVGVPGGIVEYSGMAMVGGERTLKNWRNFPGLAAAGGAMQAESFVRDPVGFAAGLAGTYAMFSLGGTALTKGIGYVRTAGKTYIPIEQIGYDANAGFPLTPKGTGVKQLRASFEQSTLIPKPTRMSTGEAVPYVPKSAALPGETLGKVYMWTAWENQPLGLLSRLRGVKEWVVGKGTSEMPGMSGAPVAESYFAKVGGQAPTTIGFDLPGKSPTLMRTELTGLAELPRGLSLDVVTKKAAGVPSSTAYIRMIDWIKGNVKPGEASLPMTKIEYEAHLQQGNVMKITGTDYFTKVGGIGKSRWFGTRLPIMEEVATGKMTLTPPNSIINIIKDRVGSGDYSYKPPATVGAYSLAASLTKGYSRVVSTPSLIKSSIRLESIDRGISRSSTPASRVSSGAASSKPISSSSIPGVSSAMSYLESPISSSLLKSISTPPYSPRESPPYTPSYTRSRSPVSTPPYSPASTPPYSPTITPPYYPKKPYTPPFLPVLPGWDGGAGPGSPRQKRHASFREYFAMGLDLAVVRPRRVKAKSFTSPKTPRVRKIKRRKHR